MCRRSAARPKLSSSATATKALRWRSAIASGSCGNARTFARRSSGMRSIIHRAERWGYAEHARRRCTIGLSAAASGWHDRRMLRIADLRLRGTTGVMAVRVRWPGSAGGDSSPPLMVFLPDAKPGGGVDTADDALCHELCRRAGMVVLCAPWAIEREGAPAPALDRAALALDWCADHASELGADPERLTLAGRGAGAAAAFALAQRARESG